MASSHMTKAAVLEVLRVARAQWDAALAECDPAQMTEPGVVGEWSVKDIVAHVTWFEQEMVRLLRERALAGSELWQLPADERNAAIFEMYRDKALPDVLSDASEVYYRLLSAIEMLTDDELNDPQRFRGMPADWQPWRILAQNTYEHYEHHLAAIRAWQKDRAEKG